MYQSPVCSVRLPACLQIAALALRSGNGLLLKGGKEAARSNAALHKVIVDAVGELGPDLIHLVTSRDEIAGEDQLWSDMHSCSWCCAPVLVASCSRHGHKVQQACVCLEDTSVSGL
jgi:hypothetical protein